MSPKQQLVATLGIFLIGLTIWFEWRDEINTLLFNAKPKPASGGSTGGIADNLPQLTPDQLNRIFGGGGTSPSSPPNQSGGH